MPIENKKETNMALTVLPSERTDHTVPYSKSGIEFVDKYSEEDINEIVVGTMSQISNLVNSIKKGKLKNIAENALFEMHDKVAKIRNSGQEKALQVIGITNLADEYTAKIQNLISK